MRAINIVKVNWGNYQCIFRTLLSCSTVTLFVLSYMFEVNKWRWRTVLVCDSETRFASSSPGKNALPENECLSLRSLPLDLASLRVTSHDMQ